MSELKFVDLFSGIGGFRLAAEQLRIRMQSVAGVEIDPTCRALYEKAFPSARSESGETDVMRIAARTKARAKRTSLLPRHDVLFAGFPCQAFSNVGKRAGLDDPRGRLFLDLCHILDAYRPGFFVFENVQKLATIGRGRLLESLTGMLDDCGYHVHVWDLRADSFGLPQQRRRLFFCGVSKRRSRRNDELLAPPAVPQAEWRYPTTWHLLEREMDRRHLVPEGTKRTILRRNPRWEGDLMVNRAIARPLTATMHKWHRANQDNYYTASYVSACNPDPYGAIPPEEVGDEPIRRITPLEGFRLQGFPDRYARLAAQLGLSFSAQYRMIGNAVPVDLAKAVIRHFLRSYL